MNDRQDPAQAGIFIRQATLDDAPVISVHRRNMFREMGYTDEAALDKMSAAFALWLPSRLVSGEYRGWFVCTEAGDIVAGLGMVILNWPPGMTDHRENRGYVLNVYTDFEYRRRGLARLLMETLLEWCKTNGIFTLILHASDEGRPLYESLGFEVTNEMRLKLE